MLRVRIQRAALPLHAQWMIAGSHSAAASRSAAAAAAASSSSAAAAAASRRWFSDSSSDVPPGFHSRYSVERRSAATASARADRAAARIERERLDTLERAAALSLHTLLARSSRSGGGPLSHATAQLHDVVARTKYPRLHLLLHRVAQLQAQGETLHARRGRRPQSARSHAHPTEARQHAEQCNDLVCKVLQVERESVQPTAERLALAERLRYEGEVPQIEAAVAQSASAETVQSSVPTAGDELDQPFSLQSSYFLLVALLRDLPAELVQVDTLDDLWSSLSAAGTQPPGWELLANGRPFEPFVPNVRLCNMLLDLYSSRNCTRQMWQIWSFMNSNAVSPNIITVNTMLAGLLRSMQTILHKAQAHIGFGGMRHAALAWGLHDLMHTEVDKTGGVLRARFEQVCTTWAQLYNENDTAEPQEDAEAAEEGAAAATACAATDAAATDAAEAANAAAAASAFVPSSPPPIVDTTTPLYVSLRFLVNEYITSRSKLLRPGSPPVTPLVVAHAPGHRDVYFHAEVLKYLNTTARAFEAAHWVAEVMAPAGLDVGNKLTSSFAGEPQANLFAFKQVVGAIERAINLCETRTDVTAEIKALGGAHSGPQRHRLNNYRFLLNALPTCSTGDLRRLLNAFWSLMTVQLRVQVDYALLSQYMRMLQRLGNDAAIVHVFEQQRGAGGLLSPERIRAIRGTDFRGGEGENFLHALVLIYSITTAAVSRRPVRIPAVPEEVLEQSRKVQDQGGALLRPLPASLLSAPSTSYAPVRYWRSYALPGLRRVMGSLQPPFFVHTMLLYEAQYAHDQALAGSAPPHPEQHQEMWHIFQRLKQVRHAAASAAPAPATTSHSSRFVPVSPHTVATNAMTLEFFVLLLRNLHHSCPHASLSLDADEDGSRDAAHRELLRRAKEVLDEAIDIYRPKAQALAAADSSTAGAGPGPAAPAENWSGLREASVDVSGGSSGEAGGVLVRHHNFVLVINAFLDACAHVPRGVALAEEVFKRFMMSEQDLALSAYAAAAVPSAAAAAAAAADSAAAPTSATDTLPAPSLLRPNLYTFSALMRTYLRAGQAERIPRVVSMMKARHRLAPTAFLYQDLMEALHERALDEQAWRERKVATASDAATATATETATSPMAATALASPAGLTALALYRELKEYKLAPTSGLFLSLLRCVATLDPSTLVQFDVHNAPLPPHRVIIALLKEMQGYERQLHPSVAPDAVPSEWRQVRPDSAFVGAAGHFTVRIEHYQVLFQSFDRFSAAAGTNLAAVAPLLASTTKLLDKLFEQGKGGAQAKSSSPSNSKGLASNFVIYHSVRTQILRHHALAIQQAQQAPRSTTQSTAQSSIIPALVQLYQNYTMHNRQETTALVGEQFLNDCIVEFHRLQSVAGSSSSGPVEAAEAAQQLRQSATSFASFWLQELPRHKGDRHALTAAHYSQLLHLHTYLVPLASQSVHAASASGASSSGAVVDDPASWNRVWSLFGQSQLEGVLPTPRLIRAIFNAMLHFGQHGPALQLYSNMLSMESMPQQIAVPADVHRMVWTCLDRMASTFPPLSQAQVDEEQRDVAAFLAKPTGTAAAGAEESPVLLLQTPFTAARSLFHQQRHERSPVMFAQLYDVLRWRRLALGVTPPAASAAGGAGAAPIHDKASLVFSASDLCEHWEKLLWSAQLTPYISRCAYVDLVVPLRGEEGNKKEGARRRDKMRGQILPSEEEMALDAAAMDTTTTTPASSGSVGAPVPPSSSATAPHASPSSLVQAQAQEVDGVLRCALRSLLRRYLAFPQKRIDPMLVRVAAPPAVAAVTDAGADAATNPLAGAAASATDPSPPLEPLVSSFFSARSIPHAVVDLAAEDVAAVFKPFPSSAESRALPGRYVRVEVQALRAYLGERTML